MTVPLLRRDRRTRLCQCEGPESATVLSAINGLAALACSVFQALANLRKALRLRLWQTA
jgi:hypothetical protein